MWGDMVNLQYRSGERESAENWFWEFDFEELEKAFFEEKIMRTRLLLMIGIGLVSGVATANAEIISNSMIVDDIEYYIQADDSVYNLGEDIEMLFRVTNLREEDVTISCSRDPEFNFWVQKDEESIWTQIQSWYWFSPGIEILAGEFEERIYTWDMIGDDENPVGIGTYNVVGLMYNEPWNDYYGNPVPSEVPVEITIVPEPSSLVLFMAGLSVLFRKRKS